MRTVLIVAVVAALAGAGCFFEAKRTPEPKPPEPTVLTEPAVPEATGDPRIAPMPRESKRQQLPPERSGPEVAPMPREK